MKIRDVKLVAFDMDGTLLNGASELTEATREACRQLQAVGCRLVIASGRTYTSAQSAIAGLAFDGYVCNNGAAIYERDGRLVACTPLAPATLLSVVETIRQRAFYYELHDVESNRWMVREDREQIKPLLDSVDLSLREHRLRHASFYHWTQPVEKEELFAQIASGERRITKLFIWHCDPRELDWVREQLSLFAKDATVTSSGRFNIEVLPPRISKWQGLQYFLQQWQITAEQTAAFGDADNDREMLAHVGHSVAMENAPDELKAICRYVAGHHDADGVAAFIRKHLLPSP